MAEGLIFRCKRKCWKSGGKKEMSYPSEYTEKCFKCINEGRYKGDTKTMPKKKGTSVFQNRMKKG